MALAKLCKEVAEKAHAYDMAQNAADRAQDAVAEARGRLESYLIDLNQRIADPVQDKNYEAAHKELQRNWFDLITAFAQQNDLELTFSGD